MVELVEFNVELEQNSGLLPTFWPLSLKMIRKHLMKILIHHEGERNGQETNVCEQGKILYINISMHPTNKILKNHPSQLYIASYHLQSVCLIHHGDYVYNKKVFKGHL